MRLKKSVAIRKNSDDRFSDFMLSENLACEVVCAETNSVLQRKFGLSVENRARNGSG